MHDDKKIYFYLAYTFFFLLAIIFSTLINGLFLKFSRTLGIRLTENESVVRWASTAKPSVGGFSFYIVFLISVSVFAALNFAESPFLNKQLIGLLLSCSLGFLIGLADDAYNTNPLLKFVGQLMCAVVLIISGVIIHITDVYSLNAIFTIFWVVGIMNSINMLDNMDGISAVTSAIIFLTCLVIIALESNFFNIYSFILMGAIGAIAGFMVYNFNPSKLYMGDTGSQFLGVLLSGISIIFLWKYREEGGPFIQFKQLLFPILAFTVPIIDTATVFYRRLARRQSPFVGGRDHTTHHLAYCGLTDRQVLFVLSTISIISGGLTVVLVYFNTAVSSTVTLLIYIYFITLFIVVQYFYDAGKKRRQKLEEKKGIQKIA